MKFKVIPGRIHQRKYRSDLKNRNEKSDTNTTKINLQKILSMEINF